MAKWIDDGKCSELSKIEITPRLGREEAEQAYAMWKAANPDIVVRIVSGEYAVYQRFVRTPQGKGRVLFVLDTAPEPHWPEMRRKLP